MCISAACPSGGYCARRNDQVVCCPQGSTLDECGASVTVATLPGTGSEATSSATESVSDDVATISPGLTTSSSSETTHNSTASSASLSAWSPSTASEWSSPSSTFGAGSTLPPYSASEYRPYAPSAFPTATSIVTNGTMYTPARQTTNSGRRVEVVWWKMAGLSLIAFNVFTFSNLYF